LSNLWRLRRRHVVRVAPQQPSQRVRKLLLLLVVLLVRAHVCSSSMRR
jgi:hypothetical protein